MVKIESVNDNLATQLEIESRGEVFVIELRRPMTLREIWTHFVSRLRRPTLATLSNGTARVVLNRRNVNLEVDTLDSE